jgi:hypothetical protein
VDVAAPKRSLLRPPSRDADDDDEDEDEDVYPPFAYLRRVGRGSNKSTWYVSSRLVTKPSFTTALDDDDAGSSSSSRVVVNPRTKNDDAVDAVASHPATGLLPRGWRNARAIRASISSQRDAAECGRTSS